MAPITPFVSRPRRLLLLVGLALPFLWLLLWAGFLIHGSQASFREFARCSTWTLETSRHFEVMEDLHERASHLLHAQNPAVEAVALQAALDRLRASREELGRRTHNEPDPYLDAADRAVADYLAKLERDRRLASGLVGSSEAAGHGPFRLESMASQAHLDHYHQTVLASFNALVRAHKDMLEASIRSSRRNATQLYVFAGIALLIALGFGAVGGIVIYQRHRSRLLTRFTQTLVDTIPDGVVAWYPEGAILKVNPGMGNLLGMPSAQAGEGLDLFRAFPADALHRLKSASSEDVLRINLVHSNGSLRAVEARVGRLEHSGGSLRIAVMRDVSAQVERERRLVEHHWQIQLGRQICSVSRDLERALNPLFLAQQILEPAQPASPAQTEAWQVLRRNSEQAALLLRQFTRMAATANESSGIRVFDLQACLLEVVEGFQIHRGSTAGIEVNLNPASCPVRGPASLVRRSFELLIQRALDVAAGRAPIHLESRQEFGMFVVEIWDPGQPGLEIDPARMFDPVFCLTASGADAGFGLFNVQETMKSLGGSATVARLSSGWTQFSLHFPMDPAS